MSDPLDTTLYTGITKNSQIVHVTSNAQKTIYGYHRALCSAKIAEMLWGRIDNPNDIDCVNCRKVANSHHKQ